MPNTDSTYPDPHLAVEQTGSGGDRKLVLVKNNQRWTFRCAPGQESSLLGRLTEMVRDPNVDLTWFDAAVLTHEIGHGLSQQLQRMRKTSRRKADA